MWGLPLHCGSSWLDVIMSVCRDVGPSIHGFASPTIEKKHKLYPRVEIDLRVLDKDCGSLGWLVGPVAPAHLAPYSLNLHQILMIHVELVI